MFLREREKPIGRDIKEGKSLFNHLELPDEDIGSLALKFHQHLHLLINIAADFAPLCFPGHIIQNVAKTIRPAFSLFEFLRLFDDGRQNLISHTLFELGSIECQKNLRLQIKQII